MNENDIEWSVKMTRTKGSFKKDTKKAPKEFFCTHCGKDFSVRKGNFFASQSPIFENEGYLPICRRCLNNLYEFYADKFGSERDAVKRICMKFDIYFSDEIYEIARKLVTKERSIIACYVSKCNLTQYKDKTFDTTLDEENNTTIQDEEDLEKISTQSSVPTQKAIKFWGFGYEPEEYKMLEEHYKMLTLQFSNADGIQDALIKDLCIIHIFKQRAIKEQNFDDVDKFMKLYQQTMKTGGLKPRNSDDGIADENAVWGTFIRDVELYSPADIYKDKTMFKDFESVKDYFERFILRPMKNFFTGQTIQDEEYSVGVEGLAEDGDGE